MDLATGDALPELLTPAIDRLRIAYMTVAMRDPNPVHVDDDYAVLCGLPRAIAHGTFVVSYAGAAITRVFGADALRRIRVDVAAPVFPGDVLRSTATLVSQDRHAADDALVLDFELAVRRDSDGARVGKGTAQVVLADPAPG